MCIFNSDNKTYIAYKLDSIAAVRRSATHKPTRSPLMIKLMRGIKRFVRLRPPTLVNVIMIAISFAGLYLNYHR